MVEEETIDGMYHIIQRYAKVNNKYVRDYDQNKDLSYMVYWDVNNLCRWAML